MMTKIREGYKETEIGVIPEDWEVCKVEDVISFLKSGLSRKLSDSDIGIPCLRSSNIIGGRLKLDDLKYWFIEDPQGAKIEDYIVDEGDILVNFINSIAQIGKACIFDNPSFRTIYTTNIFRIKTDSAIMDNKFFFYNTQTKSYNYQISLITKPAVNQASFTTGDFKSIKFPFPTLVEQQRIAEILSASDSHIEKLDKTIEDYQILKKGMMKKLLTEGIGHTEFKETEIGRIPKEWEVTTFKNIIENTQLGINEKSSEKNTGISLIKMGNLTIGGFDFSKIERLETEIIDNYSDYILEYGDFLFNTRNTPELVGKSATWKYNDRLSVFNSNIMRISVSSNIDTFWLSYYFASRNGWKSLKQISTGTTSVGAIYTKDLVKVEIPLPPLQEQQKIAHVISAIDEQIYKLELQMVDFVELKKSLMEKLLTGKVRVI